MEKHVGSWMTALAVLVLLLGFSLGGQYGSETKVIYEDVVKEVEVEIEVPGDTIYEDSTPDYLGNAVEFFWEEVEDEDEFLICDESEYDFDDVEQSRLYDEYSLHFDDDDLTVDFEIKLRYDEDDSRSCRNTFDVSVYYEDYFTNDAEEPELILND